MKKFNKIITVEVSVDSIANLLLQSLAPDFKHKELVAEAVIATSLESNNLSYVYNALNGYSAEIDFKLGDEVMCSEKEYQYANGEQSRVELGLCKVIAINLYVSNKLTVEYQYQCKDGSFKTETRHVNHTNCNKIQIQP